MNFNYLFSLSFFVFQDLEKLAPRKPDWDLKRDVSKKLEKLESRTQRAIAELIRKFEKTFYSPYFSNSLIVSY